MLLLSPGYVNELPIANNPNKITIIRCNYLKNIRNELLEEDNTRLPIINNEIIYINAEVEGTFAQLMIDTGAVSYTHLDVYKRQEDNRRR